MRFQDVLEEKRDRIVARWVEVILSTYHEDAARLFRREKDPFANPVGHSVREGAAGIVDHLLDRTDTGALRESLEEIVRVRAVQEFSPSTALSFVFSLKSVVREILPESEAGSRYAGDLARLDARVDQVALAAFDVYARCREEVNQLRINDVKRQVTWVLEKMNERDPSVPVLADEPGPAPTGEWETPAHEAAGEEEEIE